MFARLGYASSVHVVPGRSSSGLSVFFDFHSTRHSDPDDALPGIPNALFRPDLRLILFDLFRSEIFSFPESPESRATTAILPSDHLTTVSEMPVYRFTLNVDCFNLRFAYGSDQQYLPWTKFASSGRFQT